MSPYPFSKILSLLSRGAIPAMVLIVVLPPVSLQPSVLLLVVVCLLLPASVWPCVAAAIPALERSWTGIVVGSAVFSFLSVDILLLAYFRLIAPDGPIVPGGHSTMGMDGVVVLLGGLVLTLILFVVLVGPRLFTSDLKPGALAHEVNGTSTTRLVGWTLVLALSGNLILQGRQYHLFVQAMDIVEYCKRARWVGQDGTRGLLVDVSDSTFDAPLEMANWSEVEPKASSHPAETRRNGNRIISIWSGEDSLVYVSLSFRSPSRDWNNDVSYCFREDGSVTEIISKLSALKPGIRDRTRILSFDEKGREIVFPFEKAEKFPSSLMAEADVLRPEDIPVYMTARDLPFYDLLEAKRMEDRVPPEKPVDPSKRRRAGPVSGPRVSLQSNADSDRVYPPRARHQSKTSRR